MSEVDDRIVSMQFDNANFERKLAETIRSLDKLRNSLDFAASTRGMQDLNNVAKSMDMSPMASAVDGISNKFLALSTIAITTLATITTHAVQAGGRIVQAFSIAPIMEGFREYETNMGSIQTILANTKSDGSTLEDVNAALQKLNEYSDKTIYNFGQMARNIGTFTAAGVGLDESVNAIKGIANLAAISGSTSEQASTAMYQLSQALAAGKVNLMDWNSVVNAGMGGEVFKKALFETGKAMKTITDVPLSASFEEWEAKGGTFREQMQKGWLTADVLSTTLSAFSGDLDAAALSSLGFSDAAVQEMIDLGKLGQAAATEIKTFSQLMSTMKEAVGTGWADTFRLVIGDFGEAKKLFTDIGAFLSNFIGKQAAARNEMLQGWKDFGGRTALLDGLKSAFEGIQSIIRPIIQAFREIFPRTTAADLLHMTAAFRSFAERLKIGEETADKVKRAFAGAFSILKIGVEIVKNLFGVFRDAAGQLSGPASGMLDFAAKAGDALVNLREFLVEGGGIRKFFDELREVIRDPLKYIEQFRTNIVDFISSFQGMDQASEAVERIGQRFESLERYSKAVGDAWQYIQDRFSGITSALESVWGHISTWFNELKERLQKVFTPDDFSGAVDAVNVGLLGGIAAILTKFLRGGLNINFSPQLIESMTNAFDQLTGTLKAMQADLQAKALLKIAAAVGILAASVLILSTIDSAALARALGALTVGFGQLLGAMALLNKLNLGTGAAKLTVLATGMIAMATAATILSVAVKNLSSLGWTEMTKGLVGVTVMLVALTKSMNLISADTGGMIRAGIAMMAIAVAMRIMAEAVEAFGGMGWEEMAKGLIGMAAALGAVVLAMNFLPTGPMIAAGIAMIPLATGLTLLAGAVQVFALISMEDLAKGIGSIAVSLSLIALAMQLMPINLPITAAGLVILAAALAGISGVIAVLGTMDLGTLAKGIGALAATLVILSAALIAMSGTVSGAAAMIVAASALTLMAGVMVVLSKLSIAEIATSLITFAAALGILFVAAVAFSAISAPLMALGAALSLIGVSFALFGVGAMLVAKAFETMARAGKQGLRVMLESSEMLAAALPNIFRALLAAVVNLVDDILNAAPTLLKGIGAVLAQILDTVIELTPKIAQTIANIVVNALALIRGLLPQVIQTAFAVLLAFMQGIRDNMGQITLTAIGILIEFVRTLTASAFMLTDAAVNLLMTFAAAVASRMTDIVNAGVSLILSFIYGITSRVGDLVLAVANLILTFMQNVAMRANDIVNAGVNLLVSFISGIGNNLVKVTNVVGEVITRFIGALGENTQRVIDAAVVVLEEFLAGIGDNIEKVATAARKVVIKFATTISENTIALASAAFDIITNFLNDLADVIDRKAPELRRAGGRVAGAIVEGILGGLDEGAPSLLGKIGGIGGTMYNTFMSAIGANSPSKKFIAAAGFIMDGLVVGLSRNESRVEGATARVGDIMLTSLGNSISGVASMLSDMDALDPVIRPVLDLSKVEEGARQLNGLMGVSSIAPDVSRDQARLISTTSDLATGGEPVATQTGPSEVNFIQNNYSPSALSTNDIYRNTRSQFALAKEELGVL